jgi:hypothetical protein
MGQLLVRAVLISNLQLSVPVAAVKIETGAQEACAFAEGRVGSVLPRYPTGWIWFNNTNRMSNPWHQKMCTIKI